MEKYLKTLIKLSLIASKKGEMPVAAIIVRNNKIIAKAYNTRNSKQQTINHAEILAIQKANKKINNWRLNDCEMYVTLEPCSMCKNVIKESRLLKLFYLLPRNDEKYQYDKTKFVHYKEDVNFQKKYSEIISKFWNKIR